MKRILLAIASAFAFQAGDTFAASYQVWDQETVTATYHADGPTEPIILSAHPYASFQVPLPTVEPFNPALGTLISAETQYWLTNILDVDGQFTAIVVDGSDGEARLDVGAQTDFVGTGQSFTEYVRSPTAGCQAPAPGPFTCGGQDFTDGLVYIGPPPPAWPDPMTIDISLDIYLDAWYFPPIVETEFNSLDVSVRAWVSTVTTYIYAPPGTPIANAGSDQNVEAGTLVQLDGSGSADDITAPQDLQYNWTLVQQPAGSTATLTGANTMTPTFIADVNLSNGCDYHIRLVVTDQDNNISEPDETRVCTHNTPPTAEAGPNQSIHAGQVVQLDGTGSSDPVTPTENLQFAWTLTQRPAGSSAALIGSDTATPTFTADLPGTYEAGLVVRDQFNAASAPDTVTVSSLNTPPNANAGPDQGVFVGDLVTLDGSGSSDPDFDPLNYVWSFQSRPANSAAALSDDTAVSPTFTADVAGTYDIQLIVGDGFVASDPDTVTITAVTREDYAAQKVAEAINIVAALPPTSVTSEGNRDQLLRLLNHTIDHLQAGRIPQAKSKLSNAIERTDGCALRGSPDTLQGGQNPARDYINNCADQSLVYPLLIDALNTLP